MLKQVLKIRPQGVLWESTEMYFKKAQSCSLNAGKGEVIWVEGETYLSKGYLRVAPLRMTIPWSTVEEEFTSETEIVYYSIFKFWLFTQLRRIGFLMLFRLVIIEKRL